jgi:hypothetical protein
MSAERAIAWLLCGVLAGTAATAEEQDEVPDAEFIEYLGIWGETDEDWMLLDEAWAADLEETDKRNEPAPDGEDSSEKADES